MTLTGWGGPRKGKEEEAAAWRACLTPSCRRGFPVHPPKSARSPCSAVFRHPSCSPAHHTPVEELDRRMTLSVLIPAPSNYRTSIHLCLMNE